MGTGDFAAAEHDRASHAMAVSAIEAGLGPGSYCGELGSNTPDSLQVSSQFRNSKAAKLPVYYYDYDYYIDD